MPKFTLSNQHELFYETFFSTDAGASPWLVLISGHGDSSAVWAGYAKKFREKGYNILIFDNRDVGQSACATDKYTLADMANDAVLLMQNLKINEAHLVGHSIGSIIAQIASLQNSVKINSLTLIAGAASQKFINVRLIESWVSVFGSHAQNDAESDEAYQQRLKIMLPSAFSDDFLADLARKEALIMAASSYPQRQKFSAYARQFSAITAFSELRNSYKGPVLLISGDKDEVVSHEAQIELASQFPQARTLSIPGMRHCVNIEAAEECQAEILKFLSVHQRGLSDYISPTSGLSELVIPRGTYLAALQQVEEALPSLLAGADWKTVDVDYYPPRVERLWLQYGPLRINLHRIHAAEPSEVLFHKHPWPSAMRVLDGTYEMGLGFGAGELSPPLAATIMLNEGTSYEMINPEGWHYVSPVSEVTYSIMVSGCPWPGREKKSSLRLGELAAEAKQEILNFFKSKYPKKSANAEVAAKKEQTYIFSASDFERERLKRLNEVYNPHTFSLLASQLEPGMEVFEVGLGTGEIAEYIAQQVGPGGFYAAIDISDEHFPKVLAKTPGAKLLKGSVVDFDIAGSLGDRKFDVVFFRWVLGYTPKEKHTATLTRLYSLLKPGGKLICEEFDLYAAHCVDAKDRSVKISNPAFDEWVALSRTVDQKFDANFALGGTIAELLEQVTGDPSLVTTTKFQGLFDSRYKKQILGLGMKSARSALVGAGIKRVPSYDSLTDALDSLASSEDVVVRYIEDTAAVALRR